METSDHDYLLELEAYRRESARAMNEEWEKCFCELITGEARHISTSAEEETDGVY